MSFFPSLYFPSLYSKKKMPIPAKIWNWDYVWSEESRRNIASFSNLIRELHQQSTKLSDNEEYEPIHGEIHECFREMNIINASLYDRQLIAKGYGAADVIKYMEKLKELLNAAYQELALYQQTRSPQSPDAGSIQKTLLRCKGSVQDYITYIERNFYPSNGGTWSASKSPGTLRPPSQLLEMRACLDAW